MITKKTNRNIQSLPLIENAHVSKKDENICEDYLVRKHLNVPDTPINSYSTNSSDLEALLESGLKLSGLSSSSSLSWSDEYDSEAGKKVQSELEKLDKIFQHIDHDSSPYDKEEILEWKKFFPNLYILGHNTPVNSVENSEEDTNSEGEFIIEHNQLHNVEKRNSVFPRNRSSLMNKRRSDVVSQNILSLNSSRNFNVLPKKPKSLEIDQYLKIYSIRSPNTTQRNPNLQQIHLNKQKPTLSDMSPVYTSLPFITATPMKTQQRTRNVRHKLNKTLILPPIENNFRSISATPRQTSCKSLYASLNCDRRLSKNESQHGKLRSELMKLFDNIPITNR